VKTPLYIYPKRLIHGHFPVALPWSPLLPLLLLAFTSRIPAQYEYASNGNAIVITSYTGSGGVVTIPETIDHLPVVGIGNGAFSRRTSITSAIIPDTVTNIGDEAFTGMDTHSRMTELTIGRKVIRIGRGAFAGCDQLNHLTLPNGLVSIGAFAFEFCGKLTTIAIPASVTKIEDGAFCACFDLTSFSVAAANPAYCSVDGVLYDKNRHRLLQFPGGKTGGFIIPNGITNIAPLAIWNCPCVTSVTLPESITTIGDEQFAACNRLVSVFVPASVTHIGRHAFDSCMSMKGIYFYGNAPDYGEYWRGGRAKLLGGLASGTVYYLPGKTGWETNFGGRPTAAWQP